jgi:hypothetical protein
MSSTAFSPVIRTFFPAASQAQLPPLEPTQCCTASALFYRPSLLPPDVTAAMLVRPFSPSFPSPVVVRPAIAGHGCSRTAYSAQLRRNCFSNFVFVHHLTLEICSKEIIALKNVK